MSVEAAPPETNVPTESEVVRLLREQNELLRRLVVRTESGAPDPEIALAKAIAGRIAPTPEVRYVAVDTATAAFATGHTAAEAARALGSPPERTLTIRAGGRLDRLPSLRRGSA